jgi:hypothetical protein
VDLSRPSFQAPDYNISYLVDGWRRSSDGNRNLREPRRASSPPAHGEPNALIGKTEFFAVLKAISDHEFGGSLWFNGPIGDTGKLVLNYRVDVLVAAQKKYVRNRFADRINIE